MTLHNRWFSSHNSYMDDFPFAVQGDGAMPVGGVDTVRALFSHIMRFHDLWNMTCYEQDWLTNEYQMMAIAQSNVSVAEDWELGMGLAAQDAGLTVQYCMPLPTDYLISTQLPAVAQIRVSNDYASDPHTQWRIGRSAGVEGACIAEVEEGQCRALSYVLVTEGHGRILESMFQVSLAFAFALR